MEESFNFGAVLMLFESSSSLNYSIWCPFGWLFVIQVGTVLRELEEVSVVGVAHRPNPGGYLRATCMAGGGTGDNDAYILLWVE